MLCCRAPFSSQEEYSFSLTQLMVVLDKPIGLTLAPDPTTGHVYVQHIEAGMSAAESKLVLVSRHHCFSATRIAQHCCCISDATAGGFIACYVLSMNMQAHCGRS
jgi:hypothetical protein